MDYDSEADNSALTDVPNSTPAELRVPTSESDLATITAYQRTLESLEQRYAEERLARGKVVRMTAGYRQPVRLCLSMGQVVGTQRAARRRGWR